MFILSFIMLLTSRFHFGFTAVWFISALQPSGLFRLNSRLVPSMLFAGESMFAGFKIDRMTCIDLACIGVLLNTKVNPNDAKELCIAQISGALLEFEHNWKAKNAIDTLGKDKDKDEDKKKDEPEDPEDEDPDDDEEEDEDPDDEDPDEDEEEEEELYPPVVVTFFVIKNAFRIC